MKIQEILPHKQRYLFVALITFVICFIGSFSRTFAANSSETVNFQGKIANSDGTNVFNGSPSCVQSGQDTCDFQISYYDAASGGNLLGRETFSDIEIGDTYGIYNLTLGTGTFTAGTESTFLDIFYNHSDVYIEIGFDPNGANNFTEIFHDSFGNRMPVKAVPYAVVAKKADSIVGGLDTVYSNDGDKILNVSDVQGLTFDVTGGDLDFNWNGSVNTIFNNLGSGSFIVNDEASDTTPFIIDNSGNVGIGLSNPSSKLSVGNGEGFQVNDNGNIISINGVTYSWPTAQGGANTVLQNDGNGNLTWGTVSAGGVAISDLQDAVADNSLVAGDYNQSWNWALTTNNKSGLSLGESSASTGADTSILSVSTLANSTAIPLKISNLGNGDSLVIEDESSDTTPFVIDGSGNLGVGTNFPSAKVDIRNGELWLFNDGNNTRFVIGDTTNTGDYGWMQWDSTNDYFRIDTSDMPSDGLKVRGNNVAIGNIFPDQPLLVASGSTELMRIENSGKVGINDSTPDSQLSIKNDATTNGENAEKITMNQQSGGSGETNAGLKIEVNHSGDSNDTALGLMISATSATAGNMYGVMVNDISGGSGNETGFEVGAGWDVGLQVNSPAQISSTLSATGVTTIGSAGNSFVFDPVNGPSYSGTARPVKTIVLSPEYTNATLTAFYGSGTDTDTDGTITADIENSTSNQFRTYYSWISSNSNLNSYTVAIRFTLPSDFSAWQTNAMTVDFSTASTANTDNAVDIYIYSTTNSTAIFSSTDNVSSTAAAWQSVSISDSNLNDGTAPDWNSADQTAVIFIRMRSANSNEVKIGDVKLHYYAKY